MEIVATSYTLTSVQSSDCEQYKYKLIFLYATNGHSTLSGIFIVGRMIAVPSLIAGCLMHEFHAVTCKS